MNCYCSTVQKAINAQKAGAIAVIIINEIPEHDLVALDGVDIKKELKIPCFSISQKDGQIVQAQLPSTVAIVKPVVKLKETSLASAGVTNQNILKPTNIKGITGMQTATDQDAVSAPNAFSGEGSLGVGVFPNPTMGLAEVRYGFEDAGMVRVEIYNERGQLVERRFGVGPSGSMKLDGRDWANGVYVVKVVGGGRDFVGTGGKEWICKLVKGN